MWRGTSGAHDVSMTPNTLFLDIARLRNEERVARAERKSSLLRTPMSRRLLTLVRPDRPGTRHSDDQPVGRVA